jgi:acyl carrier protein
VDGAGLAVYSPRLKNSHDITIEEISRLVGVQLGKRQVNADDRFLEDLGAESMDVVNLTAAVEDKYRIRIKESEIAGIRTPSDLLRLIQKHL